MFYRLLHDMTTNCSLVRQDLEQNLPLDDIFKSKDVVAAPIRVVQLIYNSGVSWLVLFLKKNYFFEMLYKKWETRLAE